MVFYIKLIFKAKNSAQQPLISDPDLLFKIKI